MLNADSIRWAINFIKSNSDGDLFPKILEYSSVYESIDEFIKLIEGKDLSQFTSGVCRRFIVPKDEISYRQATQLDPQDSIILTAIIYQYGKGIEERRLNNNIVFSYRFSPSSNNLYSGTNSWNHFWEVASQKSIKYNNVLYCDIADFYNQISHHTIENQLVASGFPNQEIKWILNLVESTTAGVSRGVPIGPHAVHLLTEATMIPIDNSMKIQGFEFLRYVDDILIFFNSETEGKNALSKMAQILDKQQRLILQRHKTKYYKSNEFRTLCQTMIEDRPINDEEEKILSIIKKYSGDDPYRTISYDEISDEDWKEFSDEIISKIILDYINNENTDYIRLRWFYRRLMQIGHPGAIEVSLKEVIRLAPCFANICGYLASVQSIDEKRWKVIGKELLSLYKTDSVQNNEFFKLSILSLFSKNKHINHFTELVKKYDASESFIKREILLAAHQNSAFDWLRELKETYQGMDAWEKMAYIYCISGLPKDEKKYFINKQIFNRPFEIILSKWAKNKIN